MGDSIDLPLNLIIKIPFEINSMKVFADKICDISMGLALEEIIHDAVYISMGQCTVEEWLEATEENIWREHVSNDSLKEVESYCRLMMSILIPFFKDQKVPVYHRGLVDTLDVTYMNDHIVVHVTFCIF